MRYRQFPCTHVLAYAEALGRQALWPYGEISASSRNRVSQLWLANDAVVADLHVPCLDADFRESNTDGSYVTRGAN